MKWFKVLIYFGWVEFDNFVVDVWVSNIYILIVFFFMGICGGYFNVINYVK